MVVMFTGSEPSLEKGKLAVCKCKRILVYSIEKELNRKAKFDETGMERLYVLMVLWCVGGWRLEVNSCTNYVMQVL